MSQVRCKTRTRHNFLYCLKDCWHSAPLDIFQVAEDGTLGEMGAAKCFLRYPAAYSLGVFSTSMSSPTGGMSALDFQVDFIGVCSAVEEDCGGVEGLRENPNAMQQKPTTT